MRVLKVKTAIEKYDHIIELLNKIVGWVISIILIIMTILVFWQVVARFIIGSPLTFSEEVSRFLMVWLAFLGAAYAFKKGSLISVNALTDFISEKTLKVFNIVVLVMCTVFSLLLVYYGFDMVSQVSYQIAPSTRLSMGVPYLAMPVGGIIIFLNALSLIGNQLIMEDE